MMKHLTQEKLEVKVYASRKEMGDNAGREIAETMRKLLAEREEIHMIFAAAPSQNETLAALAAEPDIDWTRVNAYHMDEYVGLSGDSPQSFSTYLREHIFGLVPFKSVNCINGAADAEEECKRYGKLLADHPVDIVCLGIGENGHIAFNDPWVADFDDPVKVKVVPLDEVCRNQQVHDGCFPTIDDVPKYALTLTIPALTCAAHMFCSVPAATKRDAVRRTVTEEITIDCPASIMRKHPHAVLYCDPDSGADLL
ncbi:MAG: glucosamine-6-phosphate deaminase [Clostridia bacterium]|nr:glucosamine-6-phosphate deaminase [Clostridia bacterium]